MFDIGLGKALYLPERLHSIFQCTKMESICLNFFRREQGLAIDASNFRPFLSSGSRFKASMAVLPATCLFLADSC